MRMPIDGGAKRPEGEAPEDPPWYTGELPQPGPSQRQASGSPVSPSPWARPAPPPASGSAPPSPTPNESSDATTAAARNKPVPGGLVVLGLVVLGLVVAALAGAWFVFGRGGSAAEPSRWTLDGAKAAMAAVGFTDGSSSALLDGRPRWLAHGPESASFEAIGSPESITEVSLTLAMSDASSASDTALERFLSTWAPDAGSFVNAAMAESLLIEVDRSEDYPDHSVHFQSLTGPDGTFVVVTVDRS
jgi:hypothetical protein